MTERIISIEEIIADPENAPLPEGVSGKALTVNGLISAATFSNFDAIVNYSKRLSPEFYCLIGIMATKRDNSLVDTKGFVRWATDQQDFTKLL